MTPQSTASHLGLFCLLEILSKNGIKIQNRPCCPQNRNGTHSNDKKWEYPLKKNLIYKFYPLQNIYMGHYQNMEQSLSLMVFSQARCPRFAFSMYNISFRGALLEPHAIPRFRVRYLQKKEMLEVLLCRFLPCP